MSDLHSIKVILYKLQQLCLIVPGDGNFAESAQRRIVLPVRSNSDADRSQVVDRRHHSRRKETRTG